MRLPPPPLSASRQPISRMAELTLGIPAILAAYAFIIWTRGFGEDDRVLFRKQGKPETEPAD
ncbi:MAG: hypothetical protein HC843_08085 [Sphingomonadales bacterium]|nr:hypothetical protein [Sphingomonadales bacterium]